MIILGIGFFLVRWDERIGNVIDAKFPENLEITDDDLIHFLNTLNFASKEPLFLIQDMKRTILIHGILSNQEEYRLTDAVYDFIGILISNDQIASISKYQVTIHLLAQKLLNCKYDERVTVFFEFIRENETHSVQKIVFLGFPDAGKTSTQKFLFQKVNAETILNQTNTPTIGIEISHQNFLDLNISLFDTSGQELEQWLNSDSDVFQAAEN